MTKRCCCCLEKSQVVDLWMHRLTSATRSRSILSNVSALLRVGSVSLEDLFSNLCWILSLTLRSWGGSCDLVVTFRALWQHCLGSHQYPIDLLWLVFLSEHGDVNIGRTKSCLAVLWLRLKWFFFIVDESIDFFFSVNWFVLANKLWEMTKDATQWRRNIQIYLVYCHQGVKKLDLEFDSQCANKWINYQSSSVYFN